MKFDIIIPLTDSFLSALPDTEIEIIGDTDGVQLNLNSEGLTDFFLNISVIPIGPKKGKFNLSIKKQETLEIILEKTLV